MPARNANSQAQTKMATVIITLNVMPVSPDEDLEKIKEASTTIIERQGAKVGKTELEPVAFGLKAVVFMFAQDESKGGTEELEKELLAIPGVNSVQVTDVRRAIG